MSDSQLPQPKSKTTHDDGVDFRLLLICHAEEMQNRYSNLVNSDSGLTAVGWQQTDVLTQWLRNHYRIHMLISAPELRNRLTAQRVGQRIGLPISVHQSLSQLESRELRLDVTSEGVGDDTSNKTDSSPVPCRILQGILDPLIEKYRGQTAAMFVGVATIESVLDCLFGSERLRLLLAHTSVSELQFRDGQWFIASLNRREHLPEALPDDIVPLRAETEEIPELPEDLSMLPRIYDQNVAAFVEMDDATRRKRYNDLLSFLDIQPGSRVLDVGTGTGLVALTLAESYDTTVVGIDISPAMLERAEFFRLSSAPEIAGRIDYRLAAAQALPFSKDRFDVAICRMTLHLNRNPERVLRELWRVLRPGGLLFIADLLSTDDPVRRATQNAIEERRNPSHVAAYSVSQYRNMVVNAGFVAEAEEIAVFSRDLDDWLAELATEPANGAVVREMIEASLETDAAGINARRHGDRLLFDQRLVYLRAVKPLDEE